MEFMLEHPRDLGVNGIDLVGDEGARGRLVGEVIGEILFSFFYPFAFVVVEEFDADHERINGFDRGDDEFMFGFSGNDESDVAEDRRIGGWFAIIGRWLGGFDEFGHVDERKSDPRFYASFGARVGR